VEPLPDDLLQSMSAAREQHNEYLPLIAYIAITPNIAARLESVDQANSTVVSQVETLSQSTDSGVALMGKGTKGKEQLILLRLQAGGFRRLIATLNKLPDAIPHFRQRDIVRVIDSLAHGFSISQCDKPEITGDWIVGALVKEFAAVALGRSTVRFNMISRFGSDAEIV
jgi:hypothetical protein